MQHNPVPTSNHIEVIFACHLQKRQRAQHKLPSMLSNQYSYLFFSQTNQAANHYSQSKQDKYGVITS
mgnify:CR=1 FL=1